MASGRNSKFAEALAGLQSLRGTRIALNYVAEFRDSVILFAELNQRETFFQLSGSGLASGGKILQDLVIVLRGLLIIGLTKLNFAEIEVAISGQVRVGIELDVIGKLLNGEVVLGAVVIAQGVVVQHIWRRRFAGTTACLPVVC